MKQDKAHMRLKLFKDGECLHEHHIVLEERVTFGVNTIQGLSFEIQLKEIERDRGYDHEEAMQDSFIDAITVFAKDYLHLELRPYHKAWLRAMHKAAKSVNLVVIDDIGE